MKEKLIIYRIKERAYLSINIIYLIISPPRPYNLVANNQVLVDYLSMTQTMRTLGMPVVYRTDLYFDLLYQQQYLRQVFS